MGFSHQFLRSIIVLIILAMLGATVASVHKVGGSAGWTILDNVDYNKWTSSHTFTVGDSLLFAYNSQFHNVEQVSGRDFFSCNATSAMATYTSGSDNVTLTTPGHFYFLCGFPGHCQAGQKLHVLVHAAVSSPSLSPAFAPIPSPSNGLSPSPATASKESAQNSAASLSAMSGLVVFLVAY